MRFTSALVRAALFVRDLDVSVRFYRDALGLTESYSGGVLDTPAARTLLGIEPEASIRFRILKVPGPARGMVGLFEITDPEPPDIQRPTTTTNRGEVCLVFYAPDLDHAMKIVQEHNLPLLSAPTFFSFREGRGQREMVFRDPDGVMINLIERDPDAEF